MGRGPASAPSFLPSGHALWDQGPHCGCLPPPTLHACPPIHPSVRLSAADLCVHAVPPGLAGGRAPGLLGGVWQARWLQPPRPPAPGSCSAPAFTRLSPELGRPAGQAAGLTGRPRLRWREGQSFGRPGEGGGCPPVPGSAPQPRGLEPPPAACPACCRGPAHPLTHSDPLTGLSFIRLLFSLPSLPPFLSFLFFFCLLFCAPRQPIE